MPRSFSTTQGRSQRHSVYDEFLFQAKGDELRAASEEPRCGLHKVASCKPYFLTLVDANPFFRPDLISLVFSDVGILTPEAISQYLVAMFAG